LRSIPKQLLLAGVDGHLIEFIHGDELRDAILATGNELNMEDVTFEMLAAHAMK